MSSVRRAVCRRISTLLILYGFGVDHAYQVFDDRNWGTLPFFRLAAKQTSSGSTNGGFPTTLRSHSHASRLIWTETDLVLGNPVWAWFA